MPSTSKSTKKAAIAVKPEFVDTFSPLVLNSVARVADLQKKTLDIAAEQTAEWFGAWKKAFSYFPVTTPAFIFDVAGHAVQTAIETQKGAIDLVVEQTNTVTGIAKARGEAYSKMAEDVTTTIQKSVERSVEGQKRVLEFASEQNKAVFESTKKQLGGAAGPVTGIVDTFQRGVHAVIEAQKSFLNVASQPFATAKN
jgi:phage-related protein